MMRVRVTCSRYAPASASASAMTATHIYGTPCEVEGLGKLADDAGIQLDARGFIERSVRESGGDHALVSLSYYAHHIPSAKQRQIMFDALRAHGVPSTLRQCLLTDSALMRGAMTAFGWLTGSDSASYSVADRRKALVWSSEKAPFDADEAVRVLDECFRPCGLPLDSKA